MTGTLVNTAAVVAGATTGKLLGDRLPPAWREALMHVLGLVTIVIGVKMALKTDNVIILLLSAALGAVVGEAAQLHQRLERMGERIRQRFSEEDDGRFVAGFVTTSLLFCVGPMTIMGCVEDGLRGDYQLLLLKSTLDGIASMTFAAAFGWGVLLTAVVVLVFQGGLTLAAAWVAPAFDEAMIAALTSVGGVMVVSIGLQLLDLRSSRTANLLPGLLFAPVLVALARALGWGI